MDFGLLVGDMLVFNSWKFEMVIVKIVQVIAEN